MKFNRRLLALAAAACLGATAFPATAATLISDSFATVGLGASINGRTPDQNAFSNTWTASGVTLLGDGAGRLASNITATNTAGSASIDLGANYLVNNPGVYQLSVTMTQPAGDTSNLSWIGMGFSSLATPGGNFVGNQGAPWMLYRGSGSVATFAGPSNTLQQTLSSAAVGTPHIFTLQLDTTAAAWKFDLFIDGVLADFNGAAAGTSYTYTANPTVRYVGIAVGYNNLPLASALVDNFQFSLVPEPGRALLAGLGLLLVLGRRQRGSL